MNPTRILLSILLLALPASAGQMDKSVWPVIRAQVVDEILKTRLGVQDSADPHEACDVTFCTAMMPTSENTCACAHPISTPHGWPDHRVLWAEHWSSVLDPGWGQEPQKVHPWSHVEFVEFCDENPIECDVYRTNMSPPPRFGHCPLSGRLDKCTECVYNEFRRDLQPTQLVDPTELHNTLSTYCGHLPPPQPVPEECVCTCVNLPDTDGSCSPVVCHGNCDPDDDDDDGGGTEGDVAP